MEGLHEQIWAVGSGRRSAEREGAAGRPHHVRTDRRGNRRAGSE